jgi:pimeloyl-ACP methyl ester carboxylesterase
MKTTSGYVALDDARLYYETAGEGETLVLSHAAFLDSRMFDAQWGVLAEHFRVIRYDMRGYGRSSEAQVPACRRDDLRRLLDALNVTKAHFVGCSNGGELMLDLALEQPQLVTSLTLVGSAPSGFEMQGAPPRYLYEMFDAMQKGDVALANELQIRIWFDGEQRDPNDVDASLREKALTMNRIPVEHNTFLIADMQPLNPLLPPASTRLSEITCPTLIVVGALDHPQLLTAANLLADGILGASKIIIDAAGHVPSYEQPAAFNAALLNFLTP